MVKKTSIEDREIARVKWTKEIECCKISETFSVAFDMAAMKRLNGIHSSKTRLYNTFPFLSFRFLFGSHPFPPTRLWRALCETRKVADIARAGPFPEIQFKTRHSNTSRHNSVYFQIISRYRALSGNFIASPHVRHPSHFRTNLIFNQSIKKCTFRKPRFQIYTLLVRENPRTLSQTPLLYILSTTLNLASCIFYQTYRALTFV